MGRFTVLGKVFCASCFSLAQSEGPWDSLEDGAKSMKELGPFNLLIGDDNGVLANITIGAWSSSKKITPIFSASKMATGALFFKLDDAGTLPLDNLVSDYFDWWASSNEGKGLVTIRHLLDFTSGFAEDPCWLEVAGTFEECAQSMYDTKFNAANFGKAVYNEGHLQIAAAVAMKVTGATSWNDLWYEEVGEMAGLPRDQYWVFPSPSHPGPGGGMSVSSDQYAMFLSAFHRSFDSTAGTRMTVPPVDFWENNGKGVTMDNGYVPYPGLSYGYTSWHSGTSPFIHSLGCAGWLPGLFPATADAPGWWMQLARDGPSSFGCLGSQQTNARVEAIVAVAAEAVQASRKTTESHPTFEAVHADVECRRGGVAEKLCSCKDLTDQTCGFEDACYAGLLSEQGACTDPYATFMQELHAICSGCAEDDIGSPPGDSPRPCITISRAALAKVEAKGYHAITCQEARRMRRLKGLNPGLPCPSKSGPRRTGAAATAAFHI